MLVESKLACQPRFDFRDHRAIVTGGSRGIGRAIADALGEAGAQVHVFDVGEPEKMRWLSASLRAHRYHRHQRGEGGHRGDFRSRRPCWSTMPASPAIARSPR